MAVLKRDEPGQRTVLALNCGSSSLKFGLYSANENTARLLCQGEAEEVGSSNASFWFKDEKDPRIVAQQGGPLSDHIAALTRTIETMKACGAPEPEAVGHRLVHGGPRLRKHALVDAGVAQELDRVVDYAPLHMPPALSVLSACRKMTPAVPQAVCFDTAFHRNMPEVSRTYALPPNLKELGIERYGFHGLSLESIVAQLQPLPERLVVAHLGNGASITAIRNGVSIDTTMGLTPTGGVMMGTRCGDLDPGLVVYLLRHGYSGPEQLEKLFDHESGLLGVSGISSDVRELTRRRHDDARADLALGIFCYQVRKAIAAMTAALGSLDMLVFTGGIGEHAADLRDEICSGLSCIPNSNVAVQVLPSQEDLQIAKNTARLIQRE